LFVRYFVSLLVPTDRHRVSMNEMLHVSLFPSSICRQQESREDAESVHASAFLFVRLFWEMSRRVATGYCPSPGCGSSIICLASVSSTTCPGWLYLSGSQSSRDPSAYDTQHHHHPISRMKTSHVKGNDRSYLLQNAHRVGRLLTSFP
jgi:hypothetical protein